MVKSGRLGADTPLGKTKMSLVFPGSNRTCFLFFIALLFLCELQDV